MNKKELGYKMIAAELGVGYEIIATAGRRVSDKEIELPLERGRRKSAKMARTDADSLKSE